MVSDKHTGFYFHSCERACTWLALMSDVPFAEVAQEDARDLLECIFFCERCTAVVTCRNSLD